MDVQNLEPELRYKISRVGVRGIKKPIHIHRNGRDHVLSARIDLYVNLPETQKGSHMSRNAEIIDEIVDASVRRPCESIEAIARKIALRLLDRHEYATESEVYIEADYFMDRRTPEGTETLEHYIIFSRAHGRRNSPVEYSIGVRVVGMTACPCAMETVRKLIKERYPEVGDIVDTIPFITHNQRNIVEIEISGKDVDVEAEDLIDIAEASVSFPTYEILKRRDEGLVVLGAHENPRFVEDVVRYALDEIVRRYGNLDDSTVVRVRSESEESIHKHNAFAERISTLGELKE